MTGDTVNAAHRHMLCVIKFHPEADQARRERLDRARFHVGMTDRTDRAFAILKLLGVTSGARQMLRRARTLGHWRVRISTMTEQTRQARMVATAVLKLSIVEAFGKLHLFLR